MNGGLTKFEAQFGDVSMTYFRGGKGRALVYLHGEDGLRGSNRLLTALTENFDVIAPVHPGFDNTPLPEWMDSVDDFAHLDIALMDRIGVSDAMLVGFSLGGWIAAEIATKNKTGIRQLALVSPVGVKTGPVDRLDIPDIFAMRDAPLRQLLHHDPEKQAIDFKSASDEDLTIIARNRETFALVAWEPYLHNPKLRRRLAYLDIETLFVRGGSDRMVTGEYIEAYRKLIAGSGLKTIPTAGHFPHLEQPAALAAAIMEFATRAKISEPRS